MTWSPPDIVPQSYYTNRICRRLCEQSNDVNIFNSITSPYQSSGINPGSVCTFLLYGVYGSEQILLATISATTLPTGNIQYLIQSLIFLSTAPTLSVNDITISSVEARSMSVSWNEVPCIGQNGPITGYLLYYTNTTFNDTVNITGGDNRQYILTGLTPYTNYTVTVRAYSDAGIGPTSNETIQQTVESGKYTLLFAINVYYVI